MSALGKLSSARNVLVASLLGAGGMSVSTADAAAGMDRYKWKHRPVLVFAPDGGSGLLGTQQQIVTANRAGFLERDIVFIAVAGGDVSSQLGPEPATAAASLRRRYGVAPGEFRALLIGKDGGIKMSSTKPLSADRLFRTIDAMPMRRDEMRKAR